MCDRKASVPATPTNTNNPPKIAMMGLKLFAGIADKAIFGAKLCVRAALFARHLHKVHSYKGSKNSELYEVEKDL